MSAVHDEDARGPAPDDRWSRAVPGSAILERLAGVVDRLEAARREAGDRSGDQDAPGACGTPVMSDHWPGLETIFVPNSEILVVSSPQDVTAILQEMPEDTRRTIADRASRRVRRDHPPDHRARQLEDYYREALSRRSRPARQVKNTATEAPVELKLGLS